MPHDLKERNTETDIMIHEEKGKPPANAVLLKFDILDTTRKIVAYTSTNSSYTKSESSL